MKMDLESDKTHLMGNEMEFVFIVLLALRIRFRKLKEHALLEKVLVNEIVFELSKMERIIERLALNTLQLLQKRSKILP